MRSPATARIFLLPFTAYRSISAIDDTLHPAPPTITGRVTLVVPTVLFIVVEVFPLVVARNPEKRLPGLINDWSERFADDPIDDTTAPDTFTERSTRFTREFGLQSVPLQANNHILPSVPTDLPKNALLSVGPIFD